MPRERLTVAEQARERLLMGLRLSRLFEESDDLAAMGMPISAQSLDELVSEGFIERAATGFRPSQTGRLLLNAVIARLAP